MSSRREAARRRSQFLPPPAVNPPAVDAPPVSYLANAGAAGEGGVTADDIQGVMIGVALVAGTPRVALAAGNILRALGFAIAVADSEIADDSDAGQ
jgi:hypothetical protein